MAPAGPRPSQIESPHRWSSAGFSRGNPSRTEPAPLSWLGSAGVGGGSSRGVEAMGRGAWALDTGSEI